MTDNFLSFIFLRGKNNPKIELPQSLPPIHHFYPRNGKHCPRDSKYGSIFVRIIPSSKNSGLALRERHTQKFLVKIPLGSSFFTNVALDYLSLRNAGRARRACVTWGFFSLNIIPETQRVHSVARLDEDRERCAVCSDMRGWPH